MAVYGGPDLESDNLVFCLDVLNPKSYTGSNWNDVSGGRVGTLFNSPPLTTNYLSFNGVDQYVSFLSPIEVSTGDGFTMNFLMRVPSTQLNGVNWCFMIADRDVGAGDYEIGIYSTNTTTFIFKENGASPQTINANLGTNWNLLTFGQYQNSVPFIYLNGQFVTQSTSTFASATLDFTNIFRRDNNTGYFKCDCSYINLYDKALSEEEIKQTFHVLRNRFGI